MNVVRAPLSPEHLARIAIEEREAIQKPSEFSALLEVVAGDPPQRLLEIGTYAGGTLWAFSQLARPDAIIVSVDLPGGRFGGGYSPEQRRRFENFCRWEQRVVALPLDSHDPATVREVQDALGGRALDFLFIDGDHTYQGVKRDFELYSPLVRTGGVVALHDILPDSDHEGAQVNLFWAEVRERYRSRELIAEQEGLERGRWAGIGVLWMGSTPD
jgi:predicted O-methyltransferase YrrM